MKYTRKVGGAGKRKKGGDLLPLYFRVRFLNSVNPTIWEPGKGYDFGGKIAKQWCCRERSAVSQARLRRGFAFPFNNV